MQYVDVLPTLVDLAGDEVKPEQFDGFRFAAVLFGRSDRHRELAFGLHNNLPEGPPYPTRTVTDGSFRYIRNLTPDEIYIERHLMRRVGGSAEHNAYWTSWPRDAADDPHIYALVKRYMHRPVAELYDTANDPFELKNLANDPRYAGSKFRLVAELGRWMAAQGDPGAPVDTLRALEAARRGRHLHGIPAN